MFPLISNHLFLCSIKLCFFACVLLVVIWQLGDDCQAAKAANWGLKCSDNVYHVIDFVTRMRQSLLSPRLRLSKNVKTLVARYRFYYFF